MLGRALPSNQVLEKIVVRMLKGDFTPTETAVVYYANSQMVWCLRDSRK